MPGLKDLIWRETPEVLYREVGGAKQLCSEFRFRIQPDIGYAGEAGFIRFDKAGRITVYPGYVWNGASGPTIDTSDTICASLGHDVMYELMRAGKLPFFIFKEVADLWFYRRLLLDGTLDFRAWAWYRAVVLCGNASCNPENQPKIQMAPIPFPSANKPVFEVIPGYPITV